MTISHGIPTHDYFTIAQPSGVVDITLEDTKQELELKDPKTGDIIRALVHDVWPVSVDSLDMMDAFCKLAYGIGAKKLSGILQKKYPQIMTERTIHFILLQKL